MIGVEIGVNIENRTAGVYLTVVAKAVGDEEHNRIELQRYIMRRLKKWKYAEGVVYITRRLSSFDDYKELEEWVDEKIEEVEYEFRNFMEMLEKTENIEFEKITYRE